MANNSNISADLQNRLKELEYFFDVLKRASNTHKRNEVTETEVREILQQDFKPLSSKFDIIGRDDNQHFKEAGKLIELDNDLTPLLKLIAGITLNRMSEAVNNRQQMGQSMSSQQNDALVHPKLEPFLDQAASSFLDAYRQIQAENDAPNKETTQDNAPENRNDLTLQYKNAMKMGMQPTSKPKMEPQYTPTVRLKPN